MKLDQYKTFWNAVHPPMKLKLQSLVASLRQQLPAALKIGDPRLDEGSDEFKVCADITTVDGTVVIVLDFVLRDDEEDEAGVAISLALTGYNALVLGGYFPNNY